MPLNLVTPEGAGIVAKRLHNSQSAGLRFQKALNNSVSDALPQLTSEFVGKTQAGRHFYRGPEALGFSPRERCDVYSSRIRLPPAPFEGAECILEPASLVDFRSFERS